jgi:hypothetical protein
MKDQLKDELIKAQEKYIKFLSDEIDKKTVFLHVHGQGFSDEVVETGKKHREDISLLKQQIELSNEFCTCGNPSEEEMAHFEGDEELVYICNDCKKPVNPNSTATKVL